MRRAIPSAENRSAARARPACAELAAPGAVGGERVERRRERRRILRLDHEARLAVVDQLGDPADARADDRQAGRHRLEDRERQVVGARRLDEHVERRRAGRARRRRSRGSARPRRPPGPALELVAQRAVAVDLQPQRRLGEPSRLEQDVDALPVLEVRRDAGDERRRPPRRRSTGSASSIPYGITWSEPRRKAVREQEVGHRLRRRDHVPEPRQRGLDRQVAVHEPREPRRGDAGRVRRVRAGRSSRRSPRASRGAYGGRAPRAAAPPGVRRDRRAGRGCARRRLRRRSGQSAGAAAHVELVPRAARPRPGTPSARKLSATGSLAQTTWTSTPAAATRGASCRRCVSGPPRSIVET